MGMNTVIYDQQRYINLKKKDNVESVAEAFENLLNSVDLEDIEGICCIFSGLCVTLDIQEDLLKAEIYGKKNER